MVEQRWRWLSASALLLIAGVLTVVSVHRHWAPCRTQPTASTCLDLQTSTYGLPLWSDQQHRDVIATVLTLIATVLLTAAWTLAFGWFRRGWVCTAVFCLIGLQPLLDALLMVLDLISPDVALPLLSSGWLPLPAEMAVIPLLLGAGWVLEESARHTALAIVLGWGVTAYGSIHRFCDYLVTMVIHPSPLMTTPHPLPGQVPAGLGYATAVTLFVLAVALSVIALVGRRRPRPDDERRDRDGFTLAA